MLAYHLCLSAVSAEEKLSGWNSALIGVGLLFFFTGLSFTITVGIVLGLRIKKCGGRFVFAITVYIVCLHLCTLLFL